MKAIYCENDVRIDVDEIEDLETAQNWFDASYNFHIGRFPNNDECRCFLRGIESVKVTDGELLKEWKLEKKFGKIHNLTFTSI